jgi:glycosyltransferase involved in cell wall biosynthesis
VNTVERNSISSKIVFIVNKQPPLIDGVGDYTCLLAKHLVAYGYQIVIICSKLNAYQPSKEFMGITIYPIVEQWKESAFNHVYDLLSEIKPDFIILQYVPYSFHGKGIPFNLLSITYKLTGYAKVIVMFHEISVRYLGLDPRTWLLASLQRLVAFLISTIANKSITSIQKYSYYLGSPLRNIDIIPIGSNFLGTPDDSAIDRSRINFRLQKYVITVFGLRNEKGFFEFILHPHFRALEDITLLIVGKVSVGIIQKLQSLLQNRPDLAKKICITGTIDTGIVEELLLVSTILLDFDRGGVSAKSGTKAAAFRYSIPIVGYKGHITDGFFKDGVHVDFVVKTEDFFTRISRLLSDNTYMNFRKAQSLKFYEDKLSWSKICSSYIKALKSANSAS